VLRTPLLPFDELEAWSADLASPESDPEGLEAALAADRERLRERLRAVIERPAVRDKLVLLRTMQESSAWEVKADAGFVH
jgi:lantibiotic biosynthesis protein